MKKSPLVIIAVTISIAGLLLCTKDDDNPTGYNWSSYTDSGTFRVSNDTIFYAFSWPADTFTFCDDTGLVTVIDSAMTGEEKYFKFEVSGNILYLDYSDTMDFGSATVLQRVVWSRIGKGSGLEGAWTISSLEYRVLSGQLADSIKTVLDTESAHFTSAYTTEIGIDVSFSGNQISWTTYRRQSWADYMVNWWTCDSSNSDTCPLAVIPAKISDNSYQLTGEKTGEVVVISLNDAKDRLFTSSNPAHNEYIYYIDPVSCPNNPEPDWFSTFIDENSNGTGMLPKRSAQSNGLPKDRFLRHLLKRF